MAFGSQERGRGKTATERWERSNLEMIVAVPWRKNEDDAKMDGERLEGEVVMRITRRSRRWRNMFQNRRECT